MIPEPPPIPRSVADTSGQALRTLRERCDAVGIPTWRCDNSGLITSDPGASGPLGLLLGSSTFTRLVVRTAAMWGETDEPEITEIFEGCWAIPLPERRRRTRIGCLVGVCFSPEALASVYFEQACRSAALDVSAMRRLLGPKARFTRESAGAFRDTILWMAQDLYRVEEADQTAAGFTKQLSDCFETIDVLYALGRTMRDLASPGAFVSHLCQRVAATLSFGFVGVWMPTLEKGETDGPHEFILTGDPEFSQDLRAAMPGLLAKTSDPQAQILTSLDDKVVPGSGQILMHPVMHKGKAVAIVVAGDKFGDDAQVSSYDIQLLEAAAGYIGAFLDNAALYAGQKQFSMGVLEALTTAIDAKDRYTCGHSQRVAHLSQQLALAMGMTADEAERVRIAGLVHDVGKIGVPEAVLTKAGRLTDEEFAAIKTHPEIGHRILRDLPLLQDILPGVLHHHERIDGRGYPAGISGESIPLIARIIALADTFDAMSSTRSYRSAMPRAAVLAEVQKCAGSQFDPKLAQVFVTMDFTEYDLMVARHSASAAVDGRMAA